MTAPHDLEWLLRQAETGGPSDWEELSRELQRFTIPELRGLIYHCRLYNPILWVTTDEEAEGADMRWMTLEPICRAGLTRRGVPFIPYDPEFREQLEAYAAYLKRMATIAELPPDAELDIRQHRGVLATGLILIFTRHRDDRESYAHLSLSALDRVPTPEEVEAAVEAFFGGWRGVRKLKGSSGDRIRHFVRADPTSSG